RPLRAGACLTRAHGGRTAKILRQPRLHLTPPQPLILGLEDPVAFVGEDHQPTRYTAPLERGEHREVLRIWNPEVQLTAGDERRRLEILYVQVWREYPVLRLHRLRVPEVASVLPFREPQLLGGCVH